MLGAHAIGNNVSMEFLAQVGTHNFGSGSNYHSYKGPLSTLRGSSEAE